MEQKKGDKLAAAAELVCLFTCLPVCLCTCLSEAAGMSTATFQLEPTRSVRVGKLNLEQIEEDFVLLKTEECASDR